MSQSLASRLLDSKAHLATLAPAHLLEVLGQEQARLVREEQTARNGRIVVGDHLPTVALPDHTGREVAVGGPNGAAPASVVVFYRGAWCPFCNVALGSYQRELLPALAELGVDFVAISPQGPDGSLSVAEANQLTFPVLTDSGSAYAAGLGLVFELTDDVSDVHRALGNDFSTINDGAEWALPRPTVIVTDAEGIVRFVDVRADYTERTEPGEVLAAVRAIVGR